MLPSHNDGARSINRRGFLRVLEVQSAAVLCARASGLAALSATFAACGGLRYARSTIVGAQLMIERKEFAAGSVLVDAPDDELPIHVRQLDALQYRALSTRCMHRGCQVDPINDRFVCPCHGSEYAADGAVLTGPTELPLVEYRTTVEGARVVVHLDTPVARERRA